MVIGYMLMTVLALLTVRPKQRGDVPWGRVAIVLQLMIFLSVVAGSPPMRIRL